MDKHAKPVVITVPLKPSEKATIQNAVKRAGKRADIGARISVASWAKAILLEAAARQAA